MVRVVGHALLVCPGSTAGAIAQPIVGGSHVIELGPPPTVSYREDVVTASANGPVGTDPHALLQLLPHAVLVVARDWRVVYSNPEADRLIGASGDTLWTRCPEIENTAFATGFRYAMADRSELLTESALPRIGWCQARARPLPDGSLLVTLRQVHAHNIETGQARAALLIGEIGDALTREESLKAALERCATAMIRHLEAAHAAIWVVDDERAVVDRCGAAGVETDDAGHVAVGQDKVGEIAEEGAPYLTNDVATDPSVGAAWTERERIVAYAGYPLRVEDRIVGVMTMYTRRAIDHDLLNKLSAIADSLALGIARKRADAARRQAEERIRRQADHLESLHALGEQLAAELDAETLVQKIVDAVTRLANAQVGAFFYNLGSRSASAAVAFAGDRDIARSQLAAYRGRRLVRIDDAYTILPEERAELPTRSDSKLASLLALPVVGRDGRRIGSLVLGHERPSAFSGELAALVSSIAATAAIAVDNARLFREAHDLIAALEKSNRELDQFAYVASHDLKAPLRGISNLAQWIEDDLGDKMDDASRENMRLLRGRVVRLENLIDGILAYARAGRDGGQLMHVDLGAVVGEVWELLSPPETTHLVIDGKLPFVPAVRPQLQQIMLNLVGNALKYNAGRELTIHVGATTVGDRYEIYVRDDGVGIAPEFHQRIWGLFQTLERRDKIESTGIGLSVVRKVVEAHGGETRVESELGKGAAFFFTWPCDIDPDARTSEDERAHG